MKRVNEGPGRSWLVVVVAASSSSVAAAASLFTLKSGSLMSWTTKSQCDGMKGQNEQNTSRCKAGPRASRTSLIVVPGASSSVAAPFSFTCRPKGLVIFVGLVVCLTNRNSTQIGWHGGEQDSVPSQSTSRWCLLRAFAIGAGMRLGCATGQREVDEQEGRGLGASGAAVDSDSSSTESPEARRGSAWTASGPEGVVRRLRSAGSPSHHGSRRY